MATVTVTSNGQECIATGTVLADATEPFVLQIADGSERLRLRCSFVDDGGKGPGTGEPGITFAGLDDETAVVVFANIGSKLGEMLSFGPLAVAVFKDRGLSLIFHLTHTGTTVEVLYSFWLRVD